jgi:filamentous hemagglutinin family protein
MRGRSAAIVLAGWIWLAASGAGAETFHILSGTLSDDPTGRTQELAGAFQASFAGPDPDPVNDPPATLIVDDFELRAGDRRFAPRTPIEYQGLTPAAFLELANQIQIDGERVGLVQLRSGGEPIADDGEAVTYRFLDFRGRGASPGSAVGRLGDGPLPRRLHLEGTLHEVDQSFRLLVGECGLRPPPPVIPPGPMPPPGGGGIQIGAGGGITTPDGGGTIQIGGGDGAIVAWDEFDLSGDEQAVFVPPDGSSQPLRRVLGGDPAGIEGQLQAGGSVYLAAPAPLALGPVIRGAAPTLEELGITAPAGADVTLDEAGVLTVRTDGDLLVEGRPIDLAGLTRLVLLASGNIVIRGTLELPAGVALRIEAGGTVEIEDGSILPGPGDVVIGPDPPIGTICRGLQPIFPPVERAVGRFSLVATAARPVEIDVEPRSRRDRVSPGRRQPLPVALLGSENLDVRDVDVHSLRFGPGEAGPRAHFGSGRGRGVDVNRDRRTDLMALFSVREAEIAYGDRIVCLFGETRDGTVIEGCDEIDTMPRWPRAARGPDR